MHALGRKPDIMLSMPSETTPGAISQQDLESWLWGAADILRGPVEPANYRDFIFPMLFLKRLSDTWDEERAKALDEWGDALTPAIEADFHRFDIPDGCHWNDLRLEPDNLGVLIQDVTRQIEQVNPDRLAGIFGNAPWADHDRMPPEKLVELVGHFDRHVLSPTEVPNDLLGAGYEYLLKEFSDGSMKSAGQFFTPRAVVRLLVKILDPQPTDSVYDPACGSAGMLIEAANSVKDAGGSTDRMRFYGQEIQQTSAAIGRMNLYVHDVDDAEVKRGDTLRDPLFLDEHHCLRTFDIVIANPPFSLKNWGRDGWADDPHGRSNYGGMPPKNSGDFAWIQHMLASAKPNTGRVGVVMSHGVLFRSAAEKKIRRYIIENDLLDAVIGLAPNLFYGTSIPACLWILRRSKPADRAGAVHIIDASRCFQEESSQNYLSDEDVITIVKAYQCPSSRDQKLSPPAKSELSDVHHRSIKQTVVDIAEIKANDWDLNIGRYIEPDSPEVIEITQALADLRQAEQATADAQEAMHQSLREAGYDE